MLNPVYCTGCGKRIEVPAGFTRSKMRCAECGVFNEVPKEAQVEKAKTDTDHRGEGTLTSEAEAARPRTAKTVAEDPDIFTMKDVEPPPQPKPKPKPKAEPERDILVKGTEDDDGNPYQVTGDAATKRCPECEKKIEKTAIVCIHCGYNFESKQKKERTFEPVDQLWEVGYPFQKRLSIFMVLQVINFVTLVVSACMG